MGQQTRPDLWDARRRKLNRAARTILDAVRAASFHGTSRVPAVFWRKARDL